MHFKTIALVLAICTTLMELFPFSNAAVCKHCNTSNNECFVDTFGISGAQWMQGFRRGAPCGI